MEKRMEMEKNILKFVIKDNIFHKEFYKQWITALKKDIMDFMMK